MLGWVFAHESLYIQDDQGGQSTTCVLAQRERAGDPHITILKLVLELRDLQQRAPLRCFAATRPSVTGVTNSPEITCSKKK